MWCGFPIITTPSFRGDEHDDRFIIVEAWNQLETFQIPSHYGGLFIVKIWNPLFLGNPSHNGGFPYY